MNENNKSSESNESEEKVVKIWKPRRNKRYTDSRCAVS